MSDFIKSFFVSTALVLMPLGLAARAKFAQPSVITQSARPAASVKSSIPYGASRLDQTNTERLKQSLLDQMHKAGLPLPKNFNPFPTRSTEDAHMGAEKGLVLGIPPSRSFETDKERLKFWLDDTYPYLPACKVVFPGQNHLRYRVLTALHETSHWIALNNPTGNLNDKLFRAANRVPDNLSVEKYLEQLHTFYNSQVERIYEISASDHTLISSNDIPARYPEFSRYYVATLTEPQFHERIADASAVLYILSNYKDTEDSMKLIHSWLDYREASYSEKQHDTAPSIRVAIEVFNKNPIQGLTLIQTTQMAEAIIEAEPELSQDSVSLQAYFRVKYLDLAREIRSGHFKSSDPVRDREAVDRVKARQRLCGQPLPTFIP